MLQLSYDDHHGWRLYYKCVITLAFALTRIVNYTPRVTLQIVASFTADPRGVIYNCKIFIAKATGLIFASEAGACPSGEPSGLLVSKRSSLFVWSNSDKEEKVLEHCPQEPL